MTIQRTALLALLSVALAPLAGSAADVPLPPPPSGTSLQASPTPGRGYTLAFLGGLLAQGSAGSPSAQVDVGRDATPKGWSRARFELHVPVRLARPQWSGTLQKTDIVLGTPIVTDVGTTEDSVWIGEALASGRLLVPIAAGVRVFADAGVGLALTVEKHVEDEQFVGVTTDRKLVLAPSIQVGLGLAYQVSERVDLLFQPIAFGRRAKADASTFSALWGISYRL